MKDKILAFLEAHPAILASPLSERLFGNRMALNRILSKEPLSDENAKKIVRALNLYGFDGVHAASVVPTNENVKTWLANRPYINKSKVCRLIGERIGYFKASQDFSKRSSSEALAALMLEHGWRGEDYEAGLISLDVQLVKQK